MTLITLITNRANQAQMRMCGQARGQKWETAEVRQYVRVGDWLLLEEEVEHLKTRVHAQTRRQPECPRNISRGVTGKIGGRNCANTHTHTHTHTHIDFQKATPRSTYNFDFLREVRLSMSTPGGVDTRGVTGKVRPANTRSIIRSEYCGLVRVKSTRSLHWEQIGEKTNFNNRSKTWRLKVL